MSSEFVSDALSILCNEFKNNNQIDPYFYEKYHVKRGLRNDDGTGVLAGLTRICTVKGYLINDAERMPMEGQLIYRGYEINDIINSCESENRFCFEEVCWLLIFGTLPNREQLSRFTELLGQLRELPPYFAEDMIFKAPSQNLMNKMARSVLALYSYDELDPEDNSVEALIRQSLQLIARMPNIMNCAYQVKRRQFYKKSMYFHPINPSHSTAEMILSTTRANREFTDEEAKLLDVCLTLHAEHGGGNNSTFTTRVMSSAGTDTYSAIAAAIGSLKGTRHGGANLRVTAQLKAAKEYIKNPFDDSQIEDFLRKVIRKELGDGSGLVYGMGHAVYTLSDPRAKILKSHAKSLAEKKGFGEEFAILDGIERLTPQVFKEEKGSDKPICANVDLYSGLVYQTLGLPADLYTPLFAVARVAGWCAHRIEEVLTGGRIMRPAYKSVYSNVLPYTPLDERK
ncbi:MAG: citrate synthase [Acutalibacteraceae bacterium]|nr:citrate synthase [Acutalibacteraceae bacterium]